MKNANESMSNPESGELIKAEKVFGDLGLEIQDEDSEDTVLSLSETQSHAHSERASIENHDFHNPESYLAFFEGVPRVMPESVVREKDSTTLFTTAGIQRLEGLSNAEAIRFLVGQPVLRSQFMDKSRDGTSSSFINFSIGETNASYEDYIALTDRFIQMIYCHGIDPEGLKFTWESKPDKWGGKDFNKSLLTAYYRDIELGESVYMEGYPISPGQPTSVIDIGFGVERLQWGVGYTEYFLPSFAEYYEKHKGIGTDRLSLIFDSARGMTLLAQEGVIPSNKSHGYRLRKLSKKFVRECFQNGVELDIEPLIEIAYADWQSWNVESRLTPREVVNAIKTENIRNLNSLSLNMLNKLEGKNVYIDINQTREAFIEGASHSFAPENIESIFGA